MVWIEYELMNGNTYKPIKFDCEIHSYILTLPRNITLRRNETRQIGLDLKMRLSLYHHYALITTFHKRDQLQIENVIHTAEEGDCEIKLMCKNKSDYSMYLDKGYKIGLFIIPNPSDILRMYEGK